MVLGFTSHSAFGRFRRHLPPMAMICDLYHAIAIDWKPVITGRGNVRAEHRKTFRCEELGLTGLQVKNRLAAGTKEVFCERQQIRRPRAHGHYDDVTDDSVSTI